MKRPSSNSPPTVEIPPISDVGMEPIGELPSVQPIRSTEPLFLDFFFNPTWALGSFMQVSLTELAKNLHLDAFDEMDANFWKTLPEFLFFSDFSHAMERLYAKKPEIPSISHLTHFFHLLTWQNRDFLRRDELVLILTELMLAGKSLEEALPPLTKTLVLLAGSTCGFSNLLFLLLQLQLRLFQSVFPSFSLHCGKDVSLVERSLQRLLAQSSMTSLTQSDDVVRLPSLLRELAHLQLFWVDKAFLADEQPFYARRHTLLQFLGVEGVSLEHVIDTVTTHTSDLSEQLMTLPALLQVGMGAK